MNQPSNSTETAFEKIVQSLVRAKKTAKRLSRAEKRHHNAEYNIRAAVNTYNLAIAQQIIDALVINGFGLCEKSRYFSGFHIVNETELMGVVLTGTRTTGDHYYEHDEHYVDTYLKCKDCRDKMNLRVGYYSLVELDVRAYWTKKLRDEVVDLYSTTHIEAILVWAVSNGITYLPITRQYSQGDHYRLGESILSYKPQRSW